MNLVFKIYWVHVRNFYIGHLVSILFQTDASEINQSLFTKYYLAGFGCVGMSTMTPLRPL